MCKQANTKMEDQSIKYALNEPNIDQTKFHTVFFITMLNKMCKQANPKIEDVNGI